MTTIGGISIQGARIYSQSDYGVLLDVWVNTQEEFDEVKEMFALARTSTSIQEVQGRRPIGYDHTEDSVCTQYCTFTPTEEVMKLKDGWYLLRGIDEWARGRVPRFLFRVTLFFLGTEAQIEPGYKMKNLQRDTDHDWGV